MTKINFKQPKYIFPVVIFVPVCALIYFVMQTFGGSGEEEKKVATDRINTELPAANAEEAGTRCTRCPDVSGTRTLSPPYVLGEEKTDSEELEHGYSEEELNRLDAAEAERLRQQSRNLKNLNALLPSQGDISTPTPMMIHIPVHIMEVRETAIPRRTISPANWRRFSGRSYERQKAIEAGLGIGQPDPEEALRKQRADSIARAKQEEKERNRPKLVIKSPETNADKFNTVGAESEAVDASLIRAMIDKTTKAHEGTRLRFKLLDNVTVNGTKLKK